MSYEARRYDSVKNQRVEAVERAFHWKPNPLIHETEQSDVTQYVDGALPQGPLPNGGFPSVDAALTAYREMYGVPKPGVHQRVQLRG